MNDDPIWSYNGLVFQGMETLVAIVHGSLAKG